MKKCLCIISALFIFLFSVCGCSADKADEEPQAGVQNELLDIFGSYKHTFNENCYILAYDSDEYELFIKNSSVLSGIFYKYAYNSDGYLAVCNLTDPKETQESTAAANTIAIHSSIYSYDQMKIYLYNSDMNLVGTYDDYKSFSRALRENGIVFEKWYYREAGYSSSVKLTENAYIEDADRRGMTLFVNDEMLLWGTVREYLVIDQSKFAILFEEGIFDYELKDSKIKLNESLDTERFGQNAKVRDPHSINPFKKVKTYGAAIVVTCDGDKVNIAEYANKKALEKETKINGEWVRVKR